MGALEDIGRKYGTDKVEHRYCDLYQTVLGHLRDEPIVMLEIGLFRGASALMWREFFPKGEIHVADIVFSAGKGAVEGVDRIHLHPLNCDFSSDLKAFARRGFEFDVIVDDGGHTMRQQQLALKHLFGSLKRGGIFIMEDLHTSLAGHYPSHNAGNQPTTLELIEAIESDGDFSSHYMSSLEFQALKSEVSSATVHWTKVGKDVEVPSITSVLLRKG